MNQTIWITHKEMLDRLFSALDRRIAGLKGASYQSGFWRSGLSVCLMPDVTEAALYARPDGIRHSGKSLFMGGRSSLGRSVPDTDQTCSYRKLCRR